MEAIVFFALAVVAVLLTSLLKSSGWSDKVKHVVATVVSTAAAAFGLWQAGVDIQSDLLETALALHGASQLIYAFIRGTSFNERLESMGVK